MVEISAVLEELERRFIVGTRRIFGQALPLFQAIADVEREEAARE